MVFLIRVAIWKSKAVGGFTNLENKGDDKYRRSNILEKKLILSETTIVGLIV